MNKKNNHSKMKGFTVHFFRQKLLKNAWQTEGEYGLRPVIFQTLLTLWLTHKISKNDKNGDFNQGNLLI